MQKKTLRNLAAFGILLALVVILFDAWVRLEYIQEFGSDKFSVEIIERYAVGAIALIALIVFLGAWFGRKKDPSIPVLLPAIILPWVIVQGLLGIWTVTLKFHPFVVMLHIFGGFTVISLFFLYYLQLRPKIMSLSQVVAKKFRALAVVGLVAVLLQIALGGWLVSNYAATSCAELPVCDSGWTDNVDFKKGFDLWQKGVDFEAFKINEENKYSTDLNQVMNQAVTHYKGGILPHEAKVAIHVTHRIGAYTVFVIVGLLAVLLLRERDSVLLRRCGFVLATVLTLQMLLGMLNIVFSLPLLIAIAHNGAVVMVLLTILATNFLVSWQFRQKSTR